MATPSWIQDTSKSIALNLQLACIWEATARKPGNVHRLQDFDDTTYVDFLQAAAAFAPVLANPGNAPLGESIYRGVIAASLTATNTSLGIVLLLAPLAWAARAASLRTELPTVLAQLDVKDAISVYDA